MIKGDKNSFFGLFAAYSSTKGIVKSCKMISKSVMSKKPFSKQRYYVVSENIAAMKVSGSFDKQLQTLMLGSLVLVDNIRDMKFVDVKVIDYEHKYNIPEEVVFRCPIASLLPVNKALWKLLLAIPTPTEKVEFLKQRDLCNELSSIQVGTRVYVIPQNVDSRNVLMVTPAAIVRYKGQINKLGNGIYFGLELKECFRECDTDGVIFGQRLFSCEPGRGLFVPVNRLRLQPSYNTRTTSSKRVTSVLQMANDFEKLAHAKRNCKKDEEFLSFGKCL